MQGSQNFIFCLGGHDLEMLTIQQLLAENHQNVLDKHLSWGAAASVYQYEIQQARLQHVTPVLIELQNDLGLPAEHVILIDHHNTQAGITQPTALHQVFQRLQLPTSRWTRWFDLVAANDIDHIQGLQALNASQTEIQQIREADRRAQGISVADDVAAQKALASLDVKADGALTIVHLTHHRTTAVVDALHPALGGVGYRNLLVISHQEVNFFGEGKWVQALVQVFPAGWYGGALPTRGFWGCQGIEAQRIVECLLNVMK